MNVRKVVLEIVLELDTDKGSPQYLIGELYDKLNETLSAGEFDTATIELIES